MEFANVELLSNQDLMNTKDPRMTANNDLLKDQQSKVEGKWNMSQPSYSLACRSMTL
jgi:hypothetical protein